MVLLSVREDEGKRDVPSASGSSHTWVCRPSAGDEEEEDGGL